MVGPIGYLVAMMGRGGHSFSLGTGYSRAFLGIYFFFYQQRDV